MLCFVNLNKFLSKVGRDRSLDLFVRLAATVGLLGDRWLTKERKDMVQLQRRWLVQTELIHDVLSCAGGV